MHELTWRHVHQTIVSLSCHTQHAPNEYYPQKNDYSQNPFYTIHTNSIHKIIRLTTLSLSSQQFRFRQRNPGKTHDSGKRGKPSRKIEGSIRPIYRKNNKRSDVKVGKVNVDEQPDLAAQFGVMSIPTLLVFQNGQLVNQAVGARPKSGVLALLDR